MWESGNQEIVGRSRLASGAAELCAPVMKWRPPAVLLLPLLAACRHGSVPEALVWKLERADEIGGVRTEVGGAPKLLAAAEGGPGLWFDGAGDGLWLPVNPIEGRASFTIEILIRPEAGGPAEQRYFHVEDAAGRRGLLELRMVGADAWCLDTFLKDGVVSLPLLDRTKTHPAGRWTWVALRYDGRAMSAWVDGVKEREGDVAIAPMGAGRVSLGTRQDKRSWFRGAIREVRISAEALPPERMQH